MLPDKLMKPVMWVIFLILATGLSGFFGWEISQLQDEIESQKDIIARMKLEHEAATIAVNEAYQEKREIYEKAKDRLCEAEKKLGNNFGFCDMDIPDDLLLWKDNTPTAESIIQSSSGTDD